MLYSSSLSFLTTIVFFTSAIKPTTAGVKGINCEGSYPICAMVGANGLDSPDGTNARSVPSWFLARFKSDVPSTVVYPPGYQIGCFGNRLNGALCLFTQATGKSYSQAELWPVLKDLDYHGCRYCGSAPLDRSINDVSRGMLTINYVWSPTCGPGLCPIPGISAGRPVSVEKRKERSPRAGHSRLSPDNIAEGFR